MFIDQNFVFRTNISMDAYQSKKDAAACLSRDGARSIGKEKMAFVEKDVSLNDFLRYATNGHAFCNLFDYDPNKELWHQDSQGKWCREYPVYRSGSHKGGMKLFVKSDQYFKGAQTVFVDVDYTRFANIPDYLDTLTYKPTCVYMSYSDKQDKGGKVSRRFRMVYVFSRVLDKKELVHISQTINDQIVFDTAEPMEDDCGTRISQYMNGVYGNNECYCSGIVYWPYDFPEEQPEPVCTTTAPPSVQLQQGIVFDEKLLSDMASLSYTKFMHYYSWKYRYRYRVEKPDWIAGYFQLTDENYLQLWWYREKQVDGQRRRRKLYKNACLRRLMFPEMSPDEALFNLYVDFFRFFDNSDGAITPETLVRKVKHAFEKTQEQLTAYCDFEINYWRNHRKAFIIKHGNEVNWGVIRTIQKYIDWSHLDEVYDRSISVKDNIDRGISVSRATLFRYCHERNIDPNPRKGMTEARRRENKRVEKAEIIEQFKRIYDPNLSLRDNQANLLNHGIKLSLGTMVGWSKKYITNDTSLFDWNCSGATQPEPFNDKPDWMPDFSHWKPLFEVANPTVSESEVFKEKSDWMPKFTQWEAQFQKPYPTVSEPDPTTKERIGWDAHYYQGDEAKKNPFDYTSYLPKMNWGTCNTQQQESEPEPTTKADLGELEDFSWWKPQCCWS